MLSAEMLSWILGARRFTSIERICEARTPVTVTSCNSSDPLAPASEPALPVPDLGLTALGEAVVGALCCAESCAPAFCAGAPACSDAVAVVAAASSAMDMAIDKGCLRYTFDTAIPSIVIVRISDALRCERAHPVLNSVYLFGPLTNQSRTMCTLRQVVVALAANTAMIVRRGYESNECSHAFPTHHQRDPPAVATQRLRSPSAPQPHLAGGPGQGDLSVETDHVGSHRCLRAAGVGSFGGTNPRQCRAHRRVVRTEPRRRPRARHRLGSPTIDGRPRRYC